MEQMSLMALADTIATTSTDFKDSQGTGKGEERGGTKADEALSKIIKMQKMSAFCNYFLK